MGLLIGASCLTLCEVLDLFFYNFFLKLVNRYTRRNVTPVVDISENNKNTPFVDKNNRYNSHDIEH